jgi:hypothetical protein
MSECSKIPYTSRWIALVAMRAIARRSVTRGLTGPRGTYFCSSCRCWHLTSKARVQTPPGVTTRDRYGARSSR